LPLWDDDIAVGPRRDHFHEIGRDRIESGYIGSLIRNPKGAGCIMGNTPRILENWVGERGEPRDIRNEICLNKVGVSTPSTRVEVSDDNGCGHQEETSYLFMTSTPPRDRSADAIASGTAKMKNRCFPVMYA
jgi:hypothetical protein